MQSGVQPGNYSSVILVTPSDTAYIPFEAFMTQGAGNVTFQDQRGNSVLLTAVPIYTIMPFKGRRIMATGTTSTGILALN